MFMFTVVSVTTDTCFDKSFLTFFTYFLVRMRVLPEGYTVRGNS